jgi:hypothetical protein
MKLFLMSRLFSHLYGMEKNDFLSEQMGDDNGKITKFANNNHIDKKRKL